MAAYLDLIFHFPCEVLNDERWLHDGGAEEVPVVLMLLFELGQQGLARGVGKAGKRMQDLLTAGTVAGHPLCVAGRGPSVDEVGGCLGSCRLSTGPRAGNLPPGLKRPRAK